MITIHNIKEHTSNSDIILACKIAKEALKHSSISTRMDMLLGMIRAQGIKAREDIKPMGSGGVGQVKLMQDGTTRIQMGYGIGRYNYARVCIIYKRVEKKNITYAKVAKGELLLGDKKMEHMEFLLEIGAKFLLVRDTQEVAGKHRVGELPIHLETPPEAGWFKSRDEFDTSHYVIIDGKKISLTYINYKYI